MKVIVTIPAYNEEESITEVIKSIPREMDGVTSVEVLVISDGSTDTTVTKAQEAGADYVLENYRNLGLAQTFQRLMEEAYIRGADIMVNTDADNQYDQGQIPDLIAPVMARQADMVIGDRQVAHLDHMPPSKKIGNRLGSAIIRLLAGTSVTDASSGFRALSRDMIKRIRIFSAHTYTHESIIHATHFGFRIAEVPVTFRARQDGGSRLISGVLSHIMKSGVVIVRSILMYKAYKFLVIIGSVTMGIGVLIGLRFLVFYITQGGQGMIQSLILASILIAIGFSTIITGVLADQIKLNRLLLERLLDKE